MSPRDTMPDVTHRRFGYAVLDCEVALHLALRNAASYCAYILRGQLGSVVALAALACATLFLHVAHVGAMVPEEEVVGSDATRVVAVVQHVHPLRDRAYVQLPRHAMRSQHLTSTVVNPAVSRGVSTTSPHPALRRLADVTPKSRFERSPAVRGALSAMFVFLDVRQRRRSSASAVAAPAVLRHAAFIPVAEPGDDSFAVARGRT